MNEKRGFTLIELLAVIVILAVIALISVPLILGVIEDSKKGAFKDSVSLTFSAAELYETKNTISNDGVELKDLSLKNNNFKYGKIIKNANNELEAEDVSDGRYCAYGLLTNLVIYKGECDTTNPGAPTASVENTVYETIKEYTLTIPSIMSGIDRYEYYLSDTSTVPDTNVTVSGTSKSNKITINKVSKYVFFRVISKAGLIGDWSTAKTNYVDLTDPTSSLTTGVITSKSVTLSAVCSDPESEITKYEYSKDNGTTYVDNGNNSAYTFNNLVSGNYTFKVKCTSGALKETVASVSVSTTVIDVPTYNITPIGYATSKTVTITYPSGYTNEYSLDGGTTWNTYTTPLVFNVNGSVIARSNDGINYVSGSSFTVSKILYNDDYKIWLDLASIDYTSYASLAAVISNSTTMDILLSNDVTANYLLSSRTTILPAVLANQVDGLKLINSITTFSKLVEIPELITMLKGSSLYSTIYNVSVLNTSIITNEKKYDKKLPCYLYNSGNEYPAITGGWIYTITYNTQTFTKNATNMSIYYADPSQGFLLTNSAVNLTGYSTVYYNTSRTVSMIHCIQHYLGETPTLRYAMQTDMPNLVNYPTIVGPQVLKTLFYNMSGNSSYTPPLTFYVYSVYLMN